VNSTALPRSATRSVDQCPVGRRAVVGKLCAGGGVEDGLLLSRDGTRFVKMDAYQNPVFTLTFEGRISCVTI